MLNKKCEWREQLDHLLQRTEADPTSRYLQLATHCVAKGPQARTVVFRGLSDSGSGRQVVLIATDARSQKVDELARDSRAQICWYFGEPRIQFRLSGTVTVDSGKQAEPEIEGQYDRVWHSMSRSARTAFFANAMGELASDIADQIDLNSPPTNFTVLALCVDHAEVLDISNSPHQRRQHWLTDSGWQTESMAL